MNYLHAFFRNVIIGLQENLEYSKHTGTPSYNTSGNDDISSVN